VEGRSGEEGSVGTALLGFLFFSADWQRTHPDTGFLDHNDTSFAQRFLYLGKVCEQESYLSVRASFGSAPEQDHRRQTFRSQSKNGGKVDVCRYQDAGFSSGARENSFIIRRLHVVVTNMHGIVPVSP